MQEDHRHRSTIGTGGSWVQEHHRHRRIMGAGHHRQMEVYQLRINRELLF